MKAIKSYSSREIIAMLETDGWFWIKTTGSHQHFKHLTKAGKVTVKHPQKDIPAGTLKKILVQAGLKL